MRPLKLSASNPGYPFDIEWEAECWNGCLGSCNHLVMEGECDICHSCADCGLPLDDDCQIHSGMQLPDAIDILELPPEVHIQNSINLIHFLNNNISVWLPDNQVQISAHPYNTTRQVIRHLPAET